MKLAHDRGRGGSRPAINGKVAGGMIPIGPHHLDEGSSEAYWGHVFSGTFELPHAARPAKSPIDPLLDGVRDAADECKHERLPGDRTAACGCWGPEIYSEPPRGCAESLRNMTDAQDTHTGPGVQKAA